MRISTTRIAAAILAACAITATAQVASNSPEFEVASVKINKAEETAPSRIAPSTPGRFMVVNTPLRFVILYAYHLLDHQLIGAPEWTSRVSIDITATYAAAAAPSEETVRVMVQKLLADRFGLAAHREERQLPGYSLVVARSDGRLGPQLQRSETDCDQWLAEKRPQTDAGGASVVTPSGKRPACMMLATRRWLAGGTRTMQQIAVTLQSVLGMPVVDRTGLTGSYDIDLHWSPSNSAAPPTADSSPRDSPSIFTAVQEQLGLKLVSKPERFETLVVDQVTRPTAN